MEMMQWYVYLIRHPFSLRPVYVGKSYGPRINEVTIDQSDNARLEDLRRRLSPTRLTGEILARFDKESEATAMEATLIEWCGCSENGGLLYNETDGERKGVMS